MQSPEESPASGYGSAPGALASNSCLTENSAL
jgi:hypothetical protein